MKSKEIKWLLRKVKEELKELPSLIEGKESSLAQQKNWGWNTQDNEKELKWLIGVHKKLIPMRNKLQVSLKKVERIEKNLAVIVKKGEKGSLKIVDRLWNIRKMV